MNAIRLLCFFSFSFVLLSSCFYIQCEERQIKDDYLIVENVLQDADQVSTGLVLRLNVTGLDVSANITMVDSTDSGHGNIMKVAPAGAVVRFIHNFGMDNTFVGKRAGNITVSSTNNTGVGVNALRFTTGERNVGLGKDALAMNTVGSKNVAIGYKSLEKNTIGMGNVAVGDSALLDFNAMSTMAHFNTAVGKDALRGLVMGVDNVAIGASAGKSTSAEGYFGTGNVFIGQAAGSFAPNPGNFNIHIGSKVGSGSTVFTKFNIYIGSPGSIENGVIRIGAIPGKNQCFIQGISNSPLSSGEEIHVSPVGQVGMMRLPDRFRNNINTVNEESALIYNLKPMSFVYKNDAMKTKQYGLIAEEVDEYLPQLVVKDENGLSFTVRYHVLPILLLNEMKKQKNIIQKQADELQEQKQKREIQEDELLQQRKSIDNLMCVVDSLQQKMQQFIIE